MDFEVVQIAPELFEDLLREPGVREWYSEFEEFPHIPGSVYVAAHAPGTILFLAAQPANACAFNVHVAAHPRHRQAAVLAARSALTRLRQIVGSAVTLFTMIPADNRAAIALARLMGFKQTGVIHGAYPRGATRLDLHVYEELWAA